MQVLFSQLPLFYFSTLLAKFALSLVLLNYLIALFHSSQALVRPKVPIWVVGEWGVPRATGAWLS